MKKNPLVLFGLKWNPFSPEVETEALLATPKIELFCKRVQTLAEEGGFAMVMGDVGSGKSSALRILVDRLSRLRDVQVGVLIRPQARLADFYRELGHLFGVTLSPHNRWAATSVLRDRWLTHIKASLFRAVLVVDEAQEMREEVLNELRLLSASDLDSRSLLTTVLCGDPRLQEKLKTDELLPLGSRIRVRLVLEPATPAELLEYLRHAVTEAGDPRLMTDELMATLTEHAAGNLRVLMTLANDLLQAGFDRGVRKLDEALYLETFAQGNSADRGRKRPEAGARSR